MPRFLRTMMLLLWASAGLVLLSCEDDPLLEPRESDDGGGSYGIINLDTTGASIPTIRQQAKNPEVY